MPAHPNRRDISPKLRDRVYRELRLVCAWCGKKPFYWDGRMYLLDIDHIQPVSLGGTNDFENLRLLCVICNSIKHNKPAEFRPTMEHLTKVHRRRALRDHWHHYGHPKKLCSWLDWHSPLTLDICDEY